MKVLYAIQGTGNGHIARSLELVPLLKEMVQTDVLISGSQADLALPFSVEYRFHGLSFVFGKKGGIDLAATYRQSNTRILLHDIARMPVEQYDLVISDFEPVSAWACRRKGLACFGLSHQYAVMRPNAPRPKTLDLAGYLSLKHYAPVSHGLGFHFQPYDTLTQTPVIPTDVRKLSAENKGHITVYLPAYAEQKLVEKLQHFPDIHFQVFAKKATHHYRFKNVEVCIPDRKHFIESMASSAGVLCGAGFETPAEALYLGKKLLVIPMKQQYEQQCNAAALAKMGVPVIKSLKKKHFSVLQEWLHNSKALQLHYPDNSKKILEAVLNGNFRQKAAG